MFRGKRDGDDRKYLQWVFVGMRWSPEYSFSGEDIVAGEGQRDGKEGLGRFWFLVETGNSWIGYCRIGIL